MPDVRVCDALLDQKVFAGAAIKNEMLHRVCPHPGSSVGSLSPRKRGELVTQARDNGFDFSDGKGSRAEQALAGPRENALSSGRHTREPQGQAGHRQRRAFACERCRRPY